MSMAKKILVCGLPGSGKSTISASIASSLKAVIFNGDDVRQNISRDLDFSLQSRIEQARRIGWMCDQVINSGHNAIGDFVCPTVETRNTFNANFIIFVDRIKIGRYDDTNLIFDPPIDYHVKVTADGDVAFWTKEILHMMLNSSL